MLKLVNSLSEGTNEKLLNSSREFVKKLEQGAKDAVFVPEELPKPSPSSSVAKSPLLFTSTNRRGSNNGGNSGLQQQNQGPNTRPTPMKTLPASNIQADYDQDQNMHEQGWHSPQESNHDNEDEMILNPLPVMEPVIEDTTGWLLDPNGEDPNLLDWIKVR
jgi:hypothetical protein